MGKSSKQINNDRNIHSKIDEQSWKNDPEKGVQKGENESKSYKTIKQLDDKTIN